MWTGDWRPASCAASGTSRPTLTRVGVAAVGMLLSLMVPAQPAVQAVCPLRISRELAVVLWLTRQRACPCLSMHRC